MLDETPQAELADELEANETELEQAKVGTLIPCL
jgi:hypothetical protein